MPVSPGLPRSSPVSPGLPRSPPVSPWWPPITPWWLLCKNNAMKKTGENSSKTGVNGFLQKTEWESWGLPLMNGGLKTTWVLLYIKFSKFEVFCWNISFSTNLLFLKSVLRWSLYYSLSLCFLVLCISRELLKGCGSICISLYSGNLVDQTGSSNKSLADSVWHYQEILNWIDQYFTY